MENEDVKFPYRTHKSIINGYKSRSIYFLKKGTPILKNKNKKFIENSEKIILNYLNEKNTYTKRLLLKKPVIGLFPDIIFSKVIHNPINSSKYNV
ncbi:MAG: hypothetical protein ACUVWP_04850 [bacterium]